MDSQKFLVQKVERAETKRGKPYLRMTLVAEGGKAWEAVWWEDRQVPQGSVADVLAEEDSYNGKPQLNVKALRVLAPGPEGSEFLPKAQVDVGTLMEELKGFVQSIQHPGIRQVAWRAIQDPRWLRGPAAQTKHHAFLGGLLEHTVNLCRLADVVAKLYPALRRDLLIFDAVLHDVGKLDEIACDKVIEYTTEGKLLGHIVIGFERLLWWLEEENVDKETALLLKHLLLSHHGNVAYGSPKSPQVLEAQVFSDLDGLDARMGAMQAAIKAAGDKPWTDRAVNEPLYLGQVSQPAEVLK